MKKILLSAVICTVAATAKAGEQPETLKATVVDAKDAKPAAGAAPSQTVCSNGKNKRLVELTYGNPQTRLPCEVHYKKETEQPSHDQVLFKATTDVSFCETKAQAFVDKLASWGWKCTKG